MDGFIEGFLVFCILFIPILIIFAIAGYIAERQGWK